MRLQRRSASEVLQRRPAGGVAGDARRGVRQGLLRHSAAVKRTAKEGEPNGRNDGEGWDGAGGLVGAPPTSRRAAAAALLGEAEAAGGEPPAARRAAGTGSTGAQRDG